MANLLKIKEIIKEKKLSLREVAKKAGVTEQGLHKLIRENSTKVETLEAISEALNVSITCFFDEKQQTNIGHIDATMMDRYDKMLDTIASQQRTIETMAKKTTAQLDVVAECVSAG